MRYPVRFLSMSNRSPRLTIALLSVILCVVPRLVADDILEETRRRVEIERQKIEAEVRELKSEAQRQAKTDPTIAADLLRLAITKVENDTTLAADRRESLVRSLKQTIRDLPEKKDPASLLASELKRAETVRRAEDMTKPKVGDATQTARDIIARRKEDVASNKDIKDKSGKAMLAAFNAIEKSAIPLDGEIEFPADWAKKSMLRAKTTALKTTPEEKAILKALDTVVAADIKDMTFQEFLDWIDKETSHGMTFVVSKQALEDAGISYTSTVRLKGRGTSRMMLRKVLADLGLTFVVKDNAVQITTVARAKELMTTRTYYLGDLAGIVDIRWGPFVNQQIMANNLVSLVDMVRSSVDPLSWDVRGGAGTIAFHPSTMTLIVRQSADVHYLLGNSIR